MTSAVPPRFSFALAVLCALLIASGETRGDTVLSDFNGGGFDYTFDDFNQTIGPSVVRLTDPTNGWGGGGFAGLDLDLSGAADGRLVIDFTPEIANGAPDFTIELIEQINGSTTTKSGKWTFGVEGLTPGEPTRLVATTPLSAPTSGIGDFQSLDLSSIQQWQVLGAFGSAEPFDMSFDRIAIDSDIAPPPAYPGAEPDAAWRTQAASQIDAHRKAGLAVRVLDASGFPVPGASVHAQMQQHEFGFGSAVQAFRLRNDATQHDAYKARVAELFNLATLENNLKWQPWEGEWGGLWTQQGAVAALDWLNAQGIDGRGHVMVWPGADNLPADIRQMLSDGNLTPAEQASVRNRIANHIASVGSAAAGKVVAWDVINETHTNSDLMRELDEGDAAMVDWFDLARTAAPGAELYLNDFGILNSWGQAARDNRDQYEATIQQLQAGGAQIDGVGFQGHFRADDLTGPVELWSILDRFDELGLAMQVTEFDFETTDEQLQAAYTRDFLTAMFAHEGVDDLILWGFWEDAHWRPDAALFRSDWSIKPNGQAFLDLVFSEWWTDEQLATDDTGDTSFRGFKGDYTLTATAGAESRETAITLLDDGTVATIVLPILVGDYNNDGRVDAADYTVWRDAAGPTQDLAADGNRDGVVDRADYDLWANRLGATLPPVTASVPEPSSVYLLLAIATRGARRRTH